MGASLAPEGSVAGLPSLSVCSYTSLLRRFVEEIDTSNTVVPWFFGQSIYWSGPDFFFRFCPVVSEPLPYRTHLPLAFGCDFCNFPNRFASTEVSNDFLVTGPPSFVADTLAGDHRVYVPAGNAPRSHSPVSGPRARGVRGLQVRWLFKGKTDLWVVIPAALPASPAVLFRDHVTATPDTAFKSPQHLVICTSPIQISNRRSFLGMTGYCWRPENFCSHR